MEKIKVGFNEVGKIIEEFVGKNGEFLNGVDFVVGMSRGGLIPAALITTKIDKPLIAAYINKRDEIFFDRADWIENKNILVVDDVVRSGKTLWLLKNHLQKHCNPQNASFFTLYRVKSLANDDYNIQLFSQEIDNDVIFPWD